MNSCKHFFLIVLISFGASAAFAETHSDQDQTVIESVWQLDRNASSLSSRGNGQVLYFFSSDAYQTYQARKFQNWDNFSVVDVRNLIRLKKNQKIKIQKSQFNNSIYAVELLSGFHKGKTYYLIAEELKKNFIQEKEDVKSV